MAGAVRVAVLAALPMYVSAQPAADDSRAYHVERYETRLAIDVANSMVRGETRVHVVALRKPLERVELDADELDVSEVRAGGRALPFELRHDARGGTLVIQLARPLSARHQIAHPIAGNRSLTVAALKADRSRDRKGAVAAAISERGLRPGRRCVLAVRYSAKPRIGLRIFADQAWTEFSTSRWMPSDGRPGERASLRLALDVPAGWQVVGNGRNLGQRVRGDRQVSTWEQREPLPGFVMGFAAGRFQAAGDQRGGVRLRLLSAKHTPEELRRLGELTGPMVQFFADRAGVPYPGTSYTQVFAHKEPMQEVGSFTLLPEKYGDDLAARPDDLWLMAHELAHQWWGIGVVCRTWSDFWLNEGMATFLADVYLGERSGAARYTLEIERSRQLWEEVKSKGQDRPLHFTGWTTPGQAGGRVPYHKGGWVLHQLREEMGEDAFWRGLRDYTRRHWLGSTVSADLEEAMERACGRSLEAFFRKWVYE